jgi:glycosyltransferase involved in cell wall biosynthesis
MSLAGFIMINRFMKICLVNNLYKPYQRGGAERIIEITASGLAQKGHEVFVISTKPRFSAERPYDELLKVYRIRSCYFNLDQISLPLRLLWHIWDLFDLLSYFKIKKILKEEKPDVIITHNLKGLGSLLPRLITKVGVKHVHVLHDIQLLHPSGLMYLGKEGILDTLSAKKYQAINKKLFSSANIIISPSRWLMVEHEKRNFFINSTKIILPNPVEISKNKTSFMKKKSDDFVFLCVGHLSEAKGVNILLEAYSRLRSRMKEKRLRLILIGNNLFSKRYSGLSMSGVESIGFLGSDEIIKYYQRSDCLVVPSLCYENSPTVIYEAASYGLPVISSSMGGAKELIEDLGGILFKAGDKDDLCSKMEEAIKKPTVLESVSREESENIKKYQSSVYIEKLLSIING